MTDGVAVDASFPTAITSWSLLLSLRTESARMQARRFRLLAALSLALAASAHAETTETVAWTRHFTGTVGSLPVRATLSRLGSDISGSYCYGHCAPEGGKLFLRGQWNQLQASLEEVDYSGRAPIRTGQWSIHLDDVGKLHGNWRSANGERLLPLALHGADSNEQPFPYELRLVTDQLLASSGSCDDPPPMVTFLRVYRAGKLVQELPTQSEGTCHPFAPEIVDMNFDGWPDITLATFLGAGPDVPQQAWLFDHKRQRFVDAPQSLQDLTSPEFDGAHRLVYRYWRGGAASHGVETYHWHGGELVELDSDTSYFMPVRRGGKIRYVYTMPNYVDGHIEFDRLLLRDEHGGLAMLNPPDDSELQEEPPAWSEDYDLVTVWRRALPSVKPELVEAHSLRWVRHDRADGPRWCPDVPYYDLDTHRIGREQFGEEDDTCLDSDPEG